MKKTRKKTKKACVAKEILRDERREELIKQFLPLVKRVVHRMSARLPNDIDTDEMINSGMIGLVDALEKYDHKHDTNFSTYAQFRIRGAILDSFRNQDWVPRSLRYKANKIEGVLGRLEKELGRVPEDEEIAVELGVDVDTFRQMLDEVSNVALVSFEELGFGHGEERFQGTAGKQEGNPRDLMDYSGPLGGLLENERTQLMAKAIEKLADKERLVIKLYFYEELNLKEIGEVIGVTESRASQIRSRALLRLKNNLKSLPLASQ